MILANICKDISYKTIFLIVKLDMKLTRFAIERGLGLWKKLGDEVIYF